MLIDFYLASYLKMANPDQPTEQEHLAAA